jgi:hypothetical protein
MLHTAPTKHIRYSQHSHTGPLRHFLKCYAQPNQNTPNIVDIPSQAPHVTAWSVAHGQTKEAQYCQYSPTGPARHCFSVDVTLQWAGSHVLPHNKLTIIPRVMALPGPQTAHVIALPRWNQIKHRWNELMDPTTKKYQLIWSAQN